MRDVIDELRFYIAHKRIKRRENIELSILVGIVGGLFLSYIISFWN